MIPLTFANVGEKMSIRKIGGKDETKRFLGSLGFVEGGEIIIVSDNGGDLIVNIKNSRVAISREMANKIII